MVNKSIRANQLIGMTTLTGTLFFYEDDFAFNAQSVNAIQERPRIRYKDIESIKKRNTFGMIPNGISIYLKNGTNLVFVVTKREEVISFLNERIRASEGK